MLGKIFTSKKEDCLPIHEWLAIMVIIGILLTLTFISVFSNSSPKMLHEQAHFIIPQEIEVTVEGAVAKPGSYTIKKGATVDDVLKQAEPLPTANLKKIKMDKKLRRNQKLKIPHQVVKKSKNLSRE